MTDREKLVELELRVRFLEKIIYGLITMVGMELLGLFGFWIKDMLKL